MSCLKAIHVVTYSMYRGMEIVVEVSVLYTGKKKSMLLLIPFSVLDFIFYTLIFIPSLSYDSVHWRGQLSPPLFCINFCSVKYVIFILSIADIQQALPSLATQAFEIEILLCLSVTGSQPKIPCVPSCPRIVWKHSFHRQTDRQTHTHTPLQGTQMAPLNGSLKGLMKRPLTGMWKGLRQAKK